MAVTVVEIANYEEYSNKVDKFQKIMEDLKTKEGEARAELSNERSKGQTNILRFVAYQSGNELIVGWMILQKQESDLHVVGICSDYRDGYKKGVAKALIEAAVRSSVKHGKQGRLSLRDQSNGSGTSFYTYMGFRPVEAGSANMELNPVSSSNWKLEIVGKRETKKGHIDVVEYKFTS